MKAIQLISIGLVIISFSGFAIGLWAYSVEPNALSNPLIIGILVMSSLIFLSGIALAIMSRNKPAIEREIIDAITQEEEPKQLIQTAVETGATLKEARELTMEEQMALDKKRYFQQDEPAQVRTTQPTKVEKKAPEKVKINLSLPFGKKANNFSGILEEEERKIELEEKKRWKSL